MLGVGLESVGYSSLQSELFSDSNVTSTASLDGTTVRTFAVVDVLPGDTAATTALFPQVHYNSMRVTTSAVGLLLNNALVRTRAGASNPSADATLYAVLERNVSIPFADADAFAYLLGTVDGFYGESQTDSFAAAEGFANRWRQHTGTGAAGAQIDVIFPESTRQAYSDFAASASGFGEWQVNNELSATSYPSVTAFADPPTAEIYPALDDVLITATGLGTANVWFRETSLAPADAQLDASPQHWIAHYGQAVISAVLEGYNERIVSDSAPATALIYANLTNLIPWAVRVAGAHPVALSALAQLDLDRVANVASLASSDAVVVANGHKLFPRTGQLTARAIPRSATLLYSTAASAADAFIAATAVGIELNTRNVATDSSASATLSPIIPDVARFNNVVVDAFAAAENFAAPAVRNATSQSVARVTVEAGVKINDYFPAPVQRYMSVDPRDADLVVDIPDRSLEV